MGMKNRVCGKCYKSCSENRFFEGYVRRGLGSRRVQGGFEEGSGGRLRGKIVPEGPPLSKIIFDKSKILREEALRTGRRWMLEVGCRMI